jgi:pyruvate dehydrogenase E2 component (dihydrolipoamide acetyltransferase)
VPQFFVTREVGAGPLVEWHRQLRAAGEAGGAARLTITDLLIVFVARTLRNHPRLNSSWTGQGIDVHADVNIGVAMAVEGGVVLAVIHKADAMSLGEIGAARGELAERARSGKLRPADIAGGTFTISNLGMYGVDSFTAIIVPPQAGILAAGRIADRVVVAQGRPAVRPMLTLTLSCDHRAVDGAEAAQFMKDLAEAIAEPPRRVK